MPNDYEVPIITKAIEILDLIKERPNVSFTEIQTSLNFAKSTTYQILRTLQKHNMVVQDESGKYNLGFKFLSWGDAVSRNIDIRKISRDTLKALAQTVGVSVHLAIKTGPTSSTFIEKIDGSIYTVHNVFVGAEIVWQCSACGKVLLAYSKPDEQEKIISSINYYPYTQKSILDRDTLTKNIATVRQNGYALDVCEWTENVYGVAVPIYDHRERVIAAISCAFLAIENGENDFAPYIDYLKNASAQITAQISY